MLATLEVQEAMGMKVDREAVATLVLPQLWTLSMGPMLSLGQFSRFMSVIQKLGQRVEKEHTQYLRDHQRLDERSTMSPTPSMTPDLAQNISFEQLVHRKEAKSGGNPTSPSWDDDVWGNILGDSKQETARNTNSPHARATPTPVVTPPVAPIQQLSLGQISQASRQGNESKSVWNATPNASLTMSPSNSSSTRAPRQAPMTPNYNINLAPTPPISNTPSQSWNMSATPLVPYSTTTTSGTKPSKLNSSLDWEDFDPLK